MQAKSDVQLLVEYARQGSEPAFGEIVARYTNLIYSTVLRRVGSATVAEDVAQSVFTDLARKAPRLAGQLPENGTLVGWLYRGSLFALSKYLRDDHRRQSRESKAMQELHPSAESTPEWELVRPALDEALAALNGTEREAMLLRFFKNQGFQAIGAALGTSDDAAQKRVDRALEKLRAHLARHGITTTAAMLSAVLTTNAVESAPAGLAAKLAAASLASAAASTSSTLTIVKLLTLTPTKAVIGAGITAGLAAWLAVDHSSLSTMRQENAALRRQLSQPVPPPAESQPPAQATTDAAELAQLRGEHSELLRLRGEVAVLRARPVATNQPASALDAADRAELTQLRTEARARATLISTVDSMKHLGLAIRIWSASNADNLPTNLAQLSNFPEAASQLPSDIGTNSVEFMAYDQPLTAENLDYPFARLRQPLPSPGGGWSQVYLMVDGSVQQAKSEEGNFDQWESDWFFRHAAATTARAAAPGTANRQ